MSADEFETDIKSLLEDLNKRKAQLENLEERLNNLTPLEKTIGKKLNHDFDELSKRNQSYLFDLDRHIEDLKQGGKGDLQKEMEAARQANMACIFLWLGLKAALEEVKSPPGGPQIPSETKQSEQKDKIIKPK